MAGMVDAVAGAFVGETDRVARAVSGMTTGELCLCYVTSCESKTFNT